jgi:hypothetical protein
MSLPAPLSMVSALAPPSSRLLPLLPVIVLARPLPKPCRSALPSRGQVLRVRRQPEVDGRVDRVGALAGILRHRVPGIVDEIAVVAGAAAHVVGAEAALQRVFAAGPEGDVAGGRAGDHVVETVADARKTAGAVVGQSCRV